MPRFSRTRKKNTLSFIKNTFKTQVAFLDRVVTDAELAVKQEQQWLSTHEREPDIKAYDNHKKELENNMHRVEKNTAMRKEFFQNQSVAEEKIRRMIKIS